MGDLAQCYSDRVSISVHVIYEHGGDARPFSPAHIRLLGPLSHPSVKDEIALSIGTEYRPADVVIIERLLNRDVSFQAVDILLSQVRRDGVCLVYETDDDFIHCGPYAHLGYRDLLAQKCLAMQLARECNGVITSTERLKAALAAFNDRIIVVPNAIDERLYDAKHSPSPPDRNVIGYMGTLTHERDLELILKPLRTAAMSSQFELELVGGVLETQARSMFWRFPMRVLDVGPNTEYPSFISWMQRELHWDLAVAPLEDTEFNASKSDIKFLDYSAFGIPAIYSKVPAYSATVKHMETGYLAANTTVDWAEALSFMLNNAQRRREMAFAAKEYVTQHRTLEHAAYLWVDAIRAILNCGTGVQRV